MCVATAGVQRGWHQKLAQLVKQPLSNGFLLLVCMKILKLRTTETLQDLKNKNKNENNIKRSRILKDGIYEFEGK